jgi:regulatory protein SWI6
VAEFLAPIFDFVPSPGGASALPYNRITPAKAMPFVNYQPIPAQFPMAIDQPYMNGDINCPPYYYAPVARRPSGELLPMELGLPPSQSDVYIDQYGLPQPTFQTQYAAMGPPAKRQRSDEGYAGPAPDPEEEDESADEATETPLPAAMRLANKPLRPKPNALAGRIRSKLLTFFASPEVVDVRSALGLDSDAAGAVDFDIDMVIDSHGHTALHWACSLARSDIASQLIELGADIHRGNYAGETPLIRSVLTTNHAESGTFTQLLEHLSPSIRTLDQAYRTVIHHIALIAGVKGRAASARAYMAGVLEWVAKGNVGNVGMKLLVDVQDVHGDTALNVAARVGNRGLVKLLLEAGADKARANKLGLKPQDFGVEVDVSLVRSS